MGIKAHVMTNIHVIEIRIWLLVRIYGMMLVVLVMLSTTMINPLESLLML